MSIDRILNAIKEVQDLVEDEKETLNNGEYLRLCNAMQRVYNCANAIKTGETPSEDEEDDDNDPEVSDEEEEDDDEEDAEESVERTEDDMGVNELSELWGWQFDNGADRAVMELEGLIWNIVEGDDAKRVCAAARVLNRAANNLKPDDPADAEKLLEWKEQLVDERAIRACAEILEGVDLRGFDNKTHYEHWLYSIICDEILELLLCLGDGDALFRTKMRRNGVLKRVKSYAKEHPNDHEAQALLHELS